MVQDANTVLLLIWSGERRNFPYMLICREIEFLTRCGYATGLESEDEKQQEGRDDSDIYESFLEDSPGFSGSSPDVDMLSLLYIFAGDGNRLLASLLHSS
jgi:hypothetical protein